MTTRLLFKCLEARHCSLLLEPFGAEYVLDSEGHLKVEVDGADGDQLEVAYWPGCISVWIPASTTAVRASDHLGNSIDLGLPL